MKITHAKKAEKGARLIFWRHIRSRVCFSSPTLIVCCKNTCIFYNDPWLWNANRIELCYWPDLLLQSPNGAGETFAYEMVGWKGDTAMCRDEKNKGCPIKKLHQDNQWISQNGITASVKSGTALSDQKVAFTCADQRKSMFFNSTSILPSHSFEATCECNKVNGTCSKRKCSKTSNSETPI